MSSFHPNWGQNRGPYIFGLWELVSEIWSHFQISIFGPETRNLKKFQKSHVCLYITPGGQN